MTTGQGPAYDMQPHRGPGVTYGALYGAPQVGSDLEVKVYRRGDKRGWNRQICAHPWRHTTCLFDA